MGLTRWSAGAGVAWAWLAQRVEAEDVVFFGAVALVAWGAGARWGRDVGALVAGGVVLAVLVVRLVCAAWVTRAEVSRGERG
jgi:hypothetical protein